MSRTLVLLLLLAPACGPKSDAPNPSSRVIRTMQLNDGTPSHISFESAYAKGTIEIAGDVKIGYQSVTHSPDSAGLSRQVITLDGGTLVFDGAELRIGEKSYGALAGEVRIEISSQGVRVNGVQR